MKQSHAFDSVVLDLLHELYVIDDEEMHYGTGD
jgi:hypothetical protein